MRHAMIIANSAGEALYPLTSHEMPTAFLVLGDRKTLLQRVVEHLDGIVAIENVQVIVAPGFGARADAELSERLHVVLSDRIEVQALTDSLSSDRVPSEDNTVVLFMSADYVVQDEERFRECLADGFDQCEQDRQPIAFIATDPAGARRAVAIQCWPMDVLAESLAGGPATISSLSELATLAKKPFKNLPLGSSGWIPIDCWESVRQVLGYVEKPWGHERLWALNQHYAGKMLFIKAGESLSLQYHEVKDETIHIALGKMRFRAGLSSDQLETHILHPGMSYEIAPRTIHQMEALEDCTVIEVSTPHLTDVVRLEDRYGRT